MFKLLNLYIDKLKYIKQFEVTNKNNLLTLNPFFIFLEFFFLSIFFFLKFFFRFFGNQTLFKMGRDNYFCINQLSKLKFIFVKSHFHFYDKMSSTFSITSLITLRGGAKTEGKGPPKIVKNSGPSFCPPEKCQSWTIELRPTFLIIDENLYILKVVLQLRSYLCHLSQFTNLRARGIIKRLVCGVNHII